MNEEFTALIDCDLSCCDDGIGLGSMNGTEVGVSRPFDTPASLGGNNMLILWHIFLVLWARAWPYCVRETISLALQITEARAVQENCCSYFTDSQMKQPSNHVTSH
jgi:hypothetical protein|nr:hypothetical protein [Prosthecobacter sp.]